MLLSNFVLKQESFGIDISDLSLKIIKLKKDKSFFGLSCFGEFPIKPGIIIEGEIKNEEELVKIIKESLIKVKGNKLSTKYVTASLPEEKAFLDVIHMPKMKEEDIKKAARFEAENYIPLPINEVYFDCQIIGKIDSQSEHLDVLIAAMPQGIVDSYMSCFKKAGLIPLALEIESQAISRAIISDKFNEEPTLIIDFGATNTRLIIFSGRSLRFTDSIQIFSQLFTNVIAKEMNIPQEQAEKLKIKYGLSKEGEKGQDVFNAIKPILEDLVEQIKKHIEYYQSHVQPKHLSSDKRTIGRIFLCGGGADIKGLVDFLSLRLKISTELGNPWTNILPQPLKEVPELSYKDSLKFTTALGLALRGIKE
ncbi:MAG: type IV pilus assembly protein PilM [Candidatus Parcubacteria bacterium]|nr:type IV pilus assembly protein PilM [Candidatus Parcubacteria bacterium]